MTGNSSNVPVGFRNRILSLPQNRVWRSYLGGLILDQLIGKNGACDSHYPEDWIGSVTPACNPDSQCANEGISRVVVGGHDWLFSDLIAQDPDYFLGAEHVARFGCKPMVLVKLLDSAVRLQLQVHPTAEFASRYLGSRSGKAEAYYILDVRPEVAEGYVYLGFQRPPHRNDLRKWIQLQDLRSIESCFDRIRVKPGDTLFIPGGIPHAIGEGILMVEIMEPSDLVVRFEFERAGYTLPVAARFMNRSLDFCLDMFDFQAKPEAIVRRESMFEPRRELTYGSSGCRYELIGPETTPCFSVKKSVIQGEVRRRESSFFTGVVTAGSCVLRTEEEEVSLGTFDKFFCPAGLGEFKIESEEEVHILECFPPIG